MNYIILLLNPIFYSFPNIFNKIKVQRIRGLLDLWYSPFTQVLFGHFRPVGRSIILHKNRPYSNICFILINENFYICKNMFIIIKLLNRSPFLFLKNTRLFISSNNIVMKYLRWKFRKLPTQILWLKPITTIFLYNNIKLGISTSIGLYFV